MKDCPVDPIEVTNSCHFWSKSSRFEGGTREAKPREGGAEMGRNIQGDPGPAQNCYLDFRHYVCHWDSFFDHVVAQLTFEDHRTYTLSHGKAAR